MNRNTTIFGFVIIGCILTLIGSYLIWDARIESVGNQTTYTSKPAKKEQIKDKESTNREEPKEIVPLTQQETDLLTANMSDDVRSVVSSRLLEGEKVQILLIGSSSIEMGNPGYGALVTNQLAEAYGEWFEPTTLTFDGTTANLVEELEGDFIDWSNEYDVVLLEGMNLSNNGAVVVEDAVEHIETVNTNIKQYVDDAVLIVHPSQPLPRATYYPIEVDAFKSYLTNRGYTYIDHWANWPTGNEEEMISYLTEESTPNSLGAELWASALSTFLTGK